MSGFNTLPYLKNMAKIMKDDHVFMSHMMSAIMNNPDLRLNMIGHMSENLVLHQMMNVWGSENMTGMMDDPDKPINFGDVN